MYKVNYTTPQNYPKSQSVKDGDYLLFFYAKNYDDLLPSYDSTQNDFVNVTVKSIQKDNNFSEQVTALNNNSINAAIMEGLKKHGQDFDKSSLSQGALMSKDDTQFWSYILNGDNSTYNQKDTQLKDGDTITTLKDDGQGIKEVESIALDKTEANLTEGDMLQLTAAVTPEDATDTKVDWSSSDSTVAAVDENGKVTALEAGTAAITAAAEDGNKVATCNVTVSKKSATKVSITIKGYKGNSILSKNIEISDNLKILDVVKKALDDNKIAYDSNTMFVQQFHRPVTYIKTIDGESEGDRGGTSAWKYSINDGSFFSIDSMSQDIVKDKDKINIIFAGDSSNPTPFRDIDSISLDKAQLNLNLGDTQNLTATTAPKEATEPLNWTSSDESVAVVDGDGKVMAVKAGTVTITASGKYNKDIKAECTVNVSEKSQINVTGVTLDKTSASLTEGKTLQLTAAVTPDNAVNKKVDWSSSDPTVAKVDENGKVTALKAGTAAITATTEDGNKTAACDVTVIAKPIPQPPQPQPVRVTGISLDKTSANMAEGDTLQLTAVILPKDAANTKVDWSSSDPKVAAVDGNGKVTAIKAGTAVITAVSEDNRSVEVQCIVTVANIPKPIQITNLTKDSSFKLGEDAKISAKAENNSGKDQDESLIVALYDESGKFINYICSKQTIKNGYSSILTGIMKLPEEGIYKLKAFVWDSIENMNPLSDIIDIPVQSNK
ncbi:Ig domain-containing protein [Clostridium ljungdahlii]|uniref:Ig-like domain-containing protein n=1 Tax=Clostridium ljungdahlii TaxID=1538 RepID=UPI003862D8AE